MTITFVPTNEPWVRNDVTRWHAEHGWVWNVDVDDEFVATVFCTLLCGDGAVIHFYTGKYTSLPGAVVLGIMRKAIRVIVPNCDVLYATIPTANEKLIRVAVSLGFGLVPDGGFLRDRTESISLLKYYPQSRCHIK